MTDKYRLRIYGLVEKELDLTLNEIIKIPPVTITFDFKCVEGWVIENSRWQVVRARDVISLAKPLNRAKYAVFKAGEYTITLGLDKIFNEDVVLAYAYMGELLTEKKGGPIRLVFPSQQCYESVKWLSEIEITDEYKESTGKIIALKRIGKEP